VSVPESCFCGCPSLLAGYLHSLRSSKCQPVELSDMIPTPGCLLPPLPGPKLPSMPDLVLTLCTPKTVVYCLFIDYLLPPLPKLPRMPDLVLEYRTPACFCVHSRSHAPLACSRSHMPARQHISVLSHVQLTTILTIFVNLSSSIHVYHEHVRARGPASLCVLPLSYYLYSYLVYLFHPSLLLRYECCGAS
jgi:hypothetical protein